MTEELQPRRDSRSTLRERAAALLTRQVQHPVYPRIELMVNAGTGHGAQGTEKVELVTVRIGDEIKLVGQEELEKLFTSRKKSIRLEEEDPYNYGYEPPMWSVIDWLIVQLRVEHPGEVIEVCIFGGNRAGKTDYAAKRMCECLDMNSGWLVWAFHTDQSSSRAIQQKRIWNYLPKECKPDSGKSKKNLNARMNYNRLTGFTENCFALENGSQKVFKFYSGDADSLEGDEPDAVWSDERIPLAWIKAIGIRLLTKAGRSHGIAEELRPVWEAKLEEMRASGRYRDDGERKASGSGGGPEADRSVRAPVKLPRILRARMWQGVHLVTFTPLDGLTPAVATFINKAQTLASQRAPMLPIIGTDGKVTGYLHMPRVKRQKGYPVGAVWLWNEDNKHGGNYPGMIAKSKRERWSEADKKIKFYGFTEKTLKCLFPKFDVDIHVKPASELPREGTWYCVVDPCNGRNWFMLWILLAPDNTAWIAYEWPPVKDYVPGVGVMGEWVVDSEGKKLDGDAGPAQQPLGWGCERYRDEIYRIEGKLWKMQHPEEGNEGGTTESTEKRIQPLMRIMDSRYGRQPNATSHGTTKTIMEMMAELGMIFEPSGQTVAADGENKSQVSEGIQAINDLLDFNADLAKRSEVLADGSGGRMVPDPAQAPKCYVLDHCENVIWAGQNYTGLDGQKGASKDIVDTWRYGVIADPIYVPEGGLEGVGGGSY